MKRAFFILLACALQASAADLPPTTLGDGAFIGMEPMPGYHDRPKDQWFHQNTLTIKGNAVTLNKIPVFYYKGKKSYSASDGGFYKYQGTIRFADGAWQVELLWAGSDYAAVRVDRDGKPVPPKPEQFTLTRAKDGSLRLSKVAYRKSRPE